MRVLIVDDEYLVRFSLKSMIEELDIGFEVVAEASNGQEMLNLLTQHHPEVCIVDIRMPGIGGFAAIKKAQNQGIESNWIILTSYAEFNYATEAINIGVSAFLLKPVGPSDLQKVLLPLRMDIKRNAVLKFNNFEKSFIIAMNTKNYLFEKIVINNAWFLIIRTDFGFNSNYQNRVIFNKKILELIKNNIEEQLIDGILGAVYISSEEDICVLLEYTRNDQYLINVFVSIKEKVISLIKDNSYADIRMTGFCHDNINSWDELNSFLDKTVRFIPYRVLLGIGQIYAYAYILKRIDTLSQDYEKLDLIVEDFMNSWDKGNALDIELNATKIKKIFAASPKLSFLETTANYLAFRTGIALLPNLTEWIDLFIDSTRQKIPEIRRTVDANSRIVEKVETYLKKNIQNEIRITEIADELCLSPNYLSSIYHRLTNCTISERMTTLRLEKARELLINPKSQVKEVATEVGYHSARHFAQLYHERFGQYPSGRKS